LELRYVGFDQHDNIRAYKFDGVEKEQLIVRLVVTADLTLFLKYHINIQEGPELCARKLNADPAGLGLHDDQLTNEDLLAFTTARGAKEARKAELRRKANLRRRWPSRPNS
jgi:hypothetical protein